MGTFDAISDLATYLPLTIVRDLAGLSYGGKENMLNCAGAIFEMMGDLRERRERAMKQMQGLREFLEDPMVLEGLSSDGLASQTTGLSTDAGFEPERAVPFMRDYIAPSLDTTISAIGYAILLFAQNPAQRDKLREDSSPVKKTRSKRLCI